jgi:CrcB protein
MKTILVLCASGALGTLARYSLSGLVYRIFGSRFPYGTLAVNLLGCLLLGFLATLAEVRLALTPSMRLFLMIGFCGAFTTFSTLIYESFNLIRDGQTVSAFMNLMITVILGFMLFRVGMLIGELI